MDILNAFKKVYPAICALCYVGNCLLFENINKYKGILVITILSGSCPKETVSAIIPVFPVALLLAEL